MDLKRYSVGKGLVLVLLLALVVSLFSSGFSGARAAPDTEKVRVFIGFDVTPGPEEVALVQAFGGEIRYSYHIVPAISAELPRKALPALEQNPRVTMIEPVIEAYLVNSYQQELDNTWGVKRIQAGPVHAGEKFGSGIKVAIIDSGIDYDHPELADNYQGGDDFADDNNDPMDKHSHGTHVAGTAAALRDGQGVVGAAPKAELYALKVFPDDGGGASYDDIVAAIQWAVENGIQVTNSSYGSSGHPGNTVEKVFQDAYNRGMLHVAAAGNSGHPSGRIESVIYPAKFSSVIAVAASDSGDKRANWSSTGPAVELIAPGVSINSTMPGGGYGIKSGTSMASPHVAGVAALVWAAGPSLTNIEVRNILNDTAEDLGLSANHQGHGLVRADLAVEVVSGPTDPPGDPAIYTLSIDVYPEDAGKTTGAGEHEEGMVVDITASADAGYEFLNWSGETAEIDDVNSATTTITMNGDYSITANFEEKEADPPPPEPEVLMVTVVTDSTSYTWNSWVYITVTVEDETGGAVSGAGVAAAVSDPDGNLAESYSGTTGTDGTVGFRYRIANRAATGAYQVEANASLNDAAGNDTTIFNVTGR